MSAIAMARENTRERILDAAQALILNHGFAGTSIDMVLEQTSLTKGAFFYYFKSKSDLAHALIERYAQNDHRVMTESIARAERLSRDPLQQVLILVGLFSEMFEGLAEPYMCLFASYVYENELMTDDIRAITANSMLAWRQALSAKLREAAAKYRPRLDVDADSLADLFNSVLEGAFVMSKTLNDPGLIAQQIRHYRNYLELLFAADRG
jgi:TetR/AcrR family transcriptional repressor of nem operon